MSQPFRMQELGWLTRFFNSETFKGLFKTITIDEMVEELNYQRMAAGVSYRSLAKAAGLKTSRLRRILQGKQEMTVEDLFKLGHVVGISFSINLIPK